MAPAVHWTLTMWLLAAVGAAVTRSDEQAQTDPGTTVAEVGSERISSTQLDLHARAQLATIRSQEYNARRGALDELVADSLIRQEAAARGLSVQELIRAEIVDKTKPVADQEARLLYEMSRERYQGLSDAAALEAVTKQIRDRRSNDRRSAFVGQLKTKFGAKVLLQPPRLVITVREGAIRGDRNAPVTVVIFGDFECSACASVAKTLDAIPQKYGGRVAVAFRHFPLPLHTDGWKAAEAAECARDQGKFWEMHDSLLRSQSVSSTRGMDAQAKQLGLDIGTFAGCLSSRKHIARLEEEKAEALRYGVRGTPTVFVNGRVVPGSQTEALDRMIREELHYLPELSSVAISKDVAAAPSQ